MNKFNRKWPTFVRVSRFPRLTVLVTAFCIVLLFIGISNWTSKSTFVEELIQTQAIMKNKRFLQDYPTSFLDGALRTNSRKEFWKSQKPSFTCPRALLTREGKEGDGGKWICGLETLAKEYEGKHCSVYSFGVSGDSSFEAEIVKKTPCTVQAYDPSVDIIGKPLNMSVSRVHFHKMGVGGGKWFGLGDFKTIKEIMSINEDSFIEILKVDVEGAEFDTFERMLEDFGEVPVGQIIVELHANSNNILWGWRNGNEDKIITLLKKLEERGFRLFNIEINIINPNCCAEYSLINLNYLSLFLDKNNV